MISPALAIIFSRGVLRAHHGDVRTGFNERFHLAFSHRAAANHHHTAAGDFHQDRVVHIAFTMGPILGCSGTMWGRTPYCSQSPCCHFSDRGNLGPRFQLSRNAAVRPRFAAVSNKACT